MESRKMQCVNKLYPLESRYLMDAPGGRRIRQVTNTPFISHHPFFLAPCYDAKQRWLCIVSHRTGSPQLYLEDRGQGCLRQVTQAEDLDEWSPHPSGDWIYFTAHGCAMRVHGQTGENETLLSAADVKRIVGSNAAIAAGTTAVSRSGRHFAVRVRQEDGFAILIRDDADASWQLAYTGPMASHAQFCPDDEELLFFAGPLTDRPWMLHWPSGQATLLYQRNVQAKQWITHESWIPGRRELSMVDWPHGILAVDPRTGKTRRVTSMNAWHAIADDEGQRMVFDTNFPDRGLFMLDLTRDAAEPQWLCSPHASCMGEHWGGPFPYDNGPIKVFAPQHTHPHPRFSPDGRRIVYTSDVTGAAQVYELEL